MEGWILITSLAGLHHPNVRSSGRRRSPKVSSEMGCGVWRGRNNRWVVAVE